MNFKVSDLAPSGNESTEILLKLPAEAEKKSIPPHSTGFHPSLFPTLTSTH